MLAFLCAQLETNIGTALILLMIRTRVMSLRCRCAGPREHLLIGMQVQTAGHHGKPTVDVCSANAQQCATRVTGPGYTSHARTTCGKCAALLGGGVLLGEDDKPFPSMFGTMIK